MDVKTTTQTWTSGEGKSYVPPITYSSEDVRATKSGEVRLRELEQQLDVAETRCGSVKSQLEYMKMLYQGVKPGENDFKETEMSDSSLSSCSETSSIRDDLDIEEIKEKYERNTEKSVNYQDLLDGINQIRDPTPNEDIGYVKSSRILYEVAKEDTDEFPPIKHRRVLRKTYTLASSPRGGPEWKISKSEDQRNVKESKNLDYGSQQNLQCSSTIDPMAMEKERTVSVPIPSSRKELRKHELIVNISENPEKSDSSPVKRMKKITRNERKKHKVVNSLANNRKVSESHVEEPVVTRIKRKKRRLRNVSSKSTIGTKETRSEKNREIKKRKFRGHALVPPKGNKDHLSKVQQSWSDVVEIYHNNAVKSGSLSVVSSKHSKNESKEQEHEILEFKAKDQKIVEQCPPRVVVKKENQSSSRPVTQRTRPRSGFQNISSTYYGCMNIIKNYESPTVASTLKQVHRGYYNRIHIRNIPFVVGTSISPSHNLGLNIQQVLSIMKARQPSIKGVTPMLMRKVSRGMKPMSSLLNHINNQYQMSIPNAALQLSNSSRQSYSQSSNVTYSMKCKEQFSMINTPMIMSVANTEAAPEARSIYESNSRPLLQEPAAQCNRKLQASKQHLNSAIKGVIPSEISYQRSSYKTMGVENEMNSKTGVKEQNGRKKSDSTNNKPPDISTISPDGVREVLINLHNQFEEMNNRYEKLQEQAEQSNDKSLAKEISALEKELSIKEEEITALVKLYQEVRALKQQMKMLCEKNSLVCITTGTPFSPMQFKHRGMQPMQSLDVERRSNFGSTREPPTSLRLISLLRQIQMFQRQLLHAA